MTFGYLAMGVVALWVYAAVAGLALRFGVWLNRFNSFASEMTPEEDGDLKWLWAALFPVTMSLVIVGLALEGAGWVIFYGGKPLWRCASFFGTFSFPKRAKKTKLPLAKVIK